MTPRFRLLAALLVALLTGSADAQTARISLRAAGVDNTASLAIGSTNYGARDSATQVQAVLDLNKTSGAPLIVEWDVACSIGKPLTINSNTVIRAPPGGGVIRRAAANCQMFQNATLLRGTGGVNTDIAGTCTPATLGPFGNTNITIDGLTVNGNSANQTGLGYDYPTGYWSAVQMWGVDRLTIRNCQFLTTGNFPVHLANWTRFYAQNNYFNQNQNTSFTGGGGWQINGPGQFAVIRDTRCFAGDDPLALNGDDGTSGAGLPILYPFSGPILDVLVDGLILENARHGVRLLSSGSRLDRVTVRGVRGTFVDMFAEISDFLHSDGTIQASTAGTGNFGAIAFDDIAVDCTANNSPFFSEAHGMMLVDARVEQLSISNWHLDMPTVLRDGAIYVSGRNSFAALNHLQISNCSYHQSIGATMPFVLCTGRVDKVGFSNYQTCQSVPPTISSAPALRLATGDSTQGITSLVWDGQAADISNVIDFVSGKLVTCKLSGHHANAGGGAALNIAGGLTVKNFDPRGFMAVTASSGTITNNLGTGGTYAD